MTISELLILGLFGAAFFVVILLMVSLWTQKHR